MVFLLMNTTKRKLVSISTVYITGFPLSSVIFIAISLLNEIYSSGIVSVIRNGGTECEFHISHASDMLYNHLLIYLITYCRYNLLSNANSFLYEGFIKWHCILLSSLKLKQPSFIVCHWFMCSSPFRYFSGIFQSFSLQVS